MLPVYIIIILVLIVVPILLGRRVGRSPLEILFGEQANNLFFRKKKKEGEAAGGKDPKGTSGKTGGAELRLRQPGIHIQLRRGDIIDFNNKSHDDFLPLSILTERKEANQVAKAGEV